LVKVLGIYKNDVNKDFTGSNGRKYGESTGIGLYLCKKLCEKLELGISLSAIENQGTKINIVFPLGKFTTLK
jgi:signal transduction histidine kinase